MTQAPPRRSAATRRGGAPLTTGRGAALYVGALFGPGLLLLPGLAAAEAGPASVLAWAGLLVLSGLFAAVFSALGRRFTSSGGVIGYVGAGLGARAAAVTGWSFLTGVVAGAPVVCLIGAGYVTELTGGGRPERALIAAALLIAVLALAAGGLRTSAGAQLVLVALLLVVVIVAVAGAAPASHAANWTPFAPHGWQAIGHAAATLMLSFVGWEAVAPLTARFADPARQLPRVVGIALVVTSAAYLGLAIATVGVLGSGAGTSAPLAALLRTAVGPAGTAAAAVAAVMLTLGAVNAYVTGAAAMSGELARPAGAATNPRGAARPAPRLLAAIACSGFALIAGYGLGLASPAALVAIPTTLFLVVYLGCMTSAVRVLSGRARLAAAPAAVVVAVVLGYCGWALLAPLAVALATFLARPLMTAIRSRGTAAAARIPPAQPAIIPPAKPAIAAWLRQRRGQRRIDAAPIPAAPPESRDQEPAAGAVLVSHSSPLCSDYPGRAGMSDPARSVWSMNFPKRSSGRRSRHECPGEAREAGEQDRDPELAAYMSWVASTVGEHGWAISGRHGDKEAPPWAYSVGMWLSCQAPELVVCGLPVEIAAALINAIGARIADGERFGPDHVLDDIFPSGAAARAAHPSGRATGGVVPQGDRRTALLTFRPVEVDWRAPGRLLAISDTFYGMVRPPYLQVVWSDANGRFPWEPGFHAGFGGLQPLLWLPRDDNPPSAWTRLDQLTLAARDKPVTR